MKKFTYLFVFYLLIAGCASIPNAIHPYSESVLVETGSTEVRNELNPDAPIKAMEYKFPFEVRDIVVDSAEMKALIRIKKPEDKPTKLPSILVYYDLIENKILWTKRSYAWFPKFLDNKIIIYNYGGKIFALNKRSGEMMWEREGNYGYINQEKNIALTGLLTAFDLNTGADIWHRDVDSQFGWDEIKIDDESLIASIDGLHTFDLQNGAGWDIDMSTGKKDELGALAKNIGVGVLSGLSMAMGGGAITGTFAANEFSGMVSNILVCGGHIFFAAKDNLVCVEKGTGKEIWRTELPEKKTAQSVLLENGNHIVFANKSYCFKNNEFYRYGVPYIAKFDKTTGEQLFSENLVTKLYIQDVQLTESGYYVITENELLQYNPNGNLNIKLDVGEYNEQYGNNLELLTEDYPYAKYFVKEDQAFVPLKNYLVDPTVPVVETENGILILDADLDIQQWISKEQVYFIASGNTQTKLLRSTKYITIKNQLDDLDWEIKSGLTPLYRIKTLKRTYDQIKEENHDLLRDIYIVDNDGTIAGKIEVTEPIVSTKGHFYFTTENRLTLVSKTALK